MNKTIIGGVGHHVPERIVTNYELMSYMDTNHEWIVARSGIETRRFAAPTDTTASLAYQASLNAIADSGLAVTDIDFIIVATLSPDYFFPGVGVQLQQLLGLDTIGALDIRNQCSGFIYGLTVADQFIKTGFYKNILLVGAEIHSTGLDLTTRGRNVSVLFGDGAGAVVLTASNDPQRGIISSNLHSEGKHAKELCLLAPGTANKWAMKIEDREEIEANYALWYPYMNGNFVFKNAIARFQETIIESLTQAGIQANDIDLLIPHQANLRISQYIQKIFNLRDNQVYNNIMHYGNTTAATIPIALSEAKKEGKIHEGMTICMAAFGSGFTWGSVLMKW